MQSIGLLLKVLWSPGEAMFLLSKTPRILVPMIFGFLCALFATILVGTHVNYNELNMRMLEKSRFFSNLTEEQKDQIRKSSSSPTRNIVTAPLAAVSSAIIVVICTAIYFGIFTIFGREGSFKAFLSITAYAFIPSIFRLGAMVVSAFVVPASSLMLDELGSLSPAVFLDRDTMSPVLFAAVGTIDLVSIWILALLVIGYRFVTRKSVSTATRASVVVGVFLVYVAFKLGIAALMGA